MTLRNYSKATISAYSCGLRQFFEWRIKSNFKGVSTQEEARSYLLHRYDRGSSWQTINGDYSALRKFFKQVLKQEWDVKHIPRPRSEVSLPNVLSEQDVLRLINGGRTLKHQVFMTLLYATGLRLSECLNLQITDIDGERKQLRVMKGRCLVVGNGLGVTAVWQNTARYVNGMGKFFSEISKRRWKRENYSITIKAMRY